MTRNNTPGSDVLLAEQLQALCLHHFSFLHTLREQHRSMDMWYFVLLGSSLLVLIATVVFMQRQERKSPSSNDVSTVEKLTGVPCPPPSLGANKCFNHMQLFQHTGVCLAR